MEECKINHDALYRLLEIKCERETLEYVLDGMNKVLGEDLPDADQVQAYLMSPDKPRLSASINRWWQWTNCWSVPR